LTQSHEANEKIAGLSRYKEATLKLTKSAKQIT